MRPRSAKGRQRYRPAHHGQVFRLTIADGDVCVARAAVAREAELDGLYVIRTSESQARLCPEQVVRSYKGLAQVERALRSLKGMDVRIRPIQHRTESRVRAHIFLCLLARYVEWHLRRPWASLLFDNEPLPLDRHQRNPVAPPSEAAKPEKTERLHAEGLPIDRFHTLLAELAPCYRHLCRLTAAPDSPSSPGRPRRRFSPTP